MADNHALVGEGLKLVQGALAPFVARELQAAFKGEWWGKAYYNAPDQTRGNLPRQGGVEDLAERVDATGLLQIMDRLWFEAFNKALPPMVRTYGKELRDHRNKWAHHAGPDFTADDAYRALDTMARFLEQIDKPTMKKVRVLAQTVQRAMAAEATEAERREGGKAGATEAGGREGGKAGVAEPAPVKAVQPGLRLGMRPWREVIHPHRDVAAGQYEMARFAADLADVIAGKADADYQDATQFFARTFLTQGMQQLLGGALRRVAGAGGDPVVQLKTAFGGGKTHTMLALYHALKAGAGMARLPGLAPVLETAGVDAAALPAASVAVLVGTDLDPNRERADAAGNGVTVRTLWGEMAAQLGGQDAYALVADGDRSGAAPGANTLVELFTRFGPAVVLIDEFVAYARNLAGKEGLPAGSFESNLTFIQALTEAAKRARNALVIVSIPESEVELGGAAGREAQEHLERIFGRVESVWKPVGPEEAFEIVRRRLFGEVLDAGARDSICRQFHKLYNDQSGDFPPEAARVGYLERLVACYPIHPEVFDCLYGDWATLERFQRTRGVLRLMAAVIHALWSQGDQGPMILPGSLPVDDPAVRNQLLNYLPDTWNTVVDRDVDGDRAEPRAIDAGQTRFGQINAARRLARAIFLASAPASTGQMAQPKARGVEAPRIRLGVAQPNEPIAVFNDALGRMTDRLTYLYAGDGRHWYDTRPNLNRTAAEKAAAFDDFAVAGEIERRMRQATRDRADFAAVHLFAASGDVPDEPAARLVILPPGMTHRQNRADSSGIRAAGEILDKRGSSPRLAKNMLIFVAPDEEASAALTQATRQYLAWDWITQNKDELNLDGHGNRQAEEMKTRWSETVGLRVDETYIWLLVPTQEGTNPWKWDVSLIRGGGGIVQRAAAKLRQSGQLISRWSPALLKMALDRWLWKEAEHYETKKLWEAMTNYGYLPRLSKQRVLIEAIAEGLRGQDYFGYATSMSAEGRYEGLRFGEPTIPDEVHIDSLSVVVKPRAAIRQQEADEARERERLRPRISNGDEPGYDTTGGNTGGGTTVIDRPPIDVPTTPPKPVYSRFHGTVEIEAERMIRDAPTIAHEIVQHLTALPRAKVRITIDIAAELPEGAPDTVIRTVSENSRTLKFRDFGFEES